MQKKLKSYLRNSDQFPKFTHEKQLKSSLQPYTQSITYTDAKFFSSMESDLKSIAIDARNQQKILQHKKKIKQLKQIPQRTSETTIDQMLHANILIDYFRSYQMDYCYSMFMRQKNMDSNDIIIKSDLADVLNLKEEFHKDPRFNVSILELLMKKIDKIQNVLDLKQKRMVSSTIQCQLISNHNQTNNLLLTELKLEELRKQIENQEKKYFESQLHLFKQQQLQSVKQAISKAYQEKQKILQQAFQAKLKELVKRNTEQFAGSIYTKQLESYLKENQKLRSELKILKDQIIKFQKQFLQHDCFKNQSVQSRISQNEQERKLLQSKRSQYQLALRNMATNVQDLSMKRQKMFNDGKKQTQDYLVKMRQHRQSKDYMIQKIQSQSRGFERRIQDLSRQNTKLSEENQLYRSQINGIKKNQDEKIQLSDKKKFSLTQLKVPVKNVMINVCEQQISGQIGVDKYNSQIQESVISETSVEFNNRQQKKSQRNQIINQLKMQRDQLKSQVRRIMEINEIDAL